MLCCRLCLLMRQHVHPDLHTRFVLQLTRQVKQSKDPFVAEVFAAVVIRGASSASSASRRMAGRSAVRRFSTDVLECVGAHRVGGDGNDMRDEESRGEFVCSLDF